MSVLAYMKVEIGNATLYQGDCLEVLPKLSGIDAVVSDPPYGMDYNTDSTRFKMRRGGNKANWGGVVGDDRPFDPTPFLNYERVILWGSNHYAERLPVGTTLVWIKRHAEAFGTFLSDAEIAWMKGGHGVYCKLGPFPQSIAVDRVHPTQKPIALLEWCIEKIKPPRNGVILDPYMGSGSTGIASTGLGFQFIGIEIEPTYFTVACERINAAQSQGRLFE